MEERSPSRPARGKEPKPPRGPGGGKESQPPRDLCKWEAYACLMNLHSLVVSEGILPADGPSFSIVHGALTDELRSFSYFAVEDFAQLGKTCSQAASFAFDLECRFMLRCEAAWARRVEAAD